MFYNHISDLMDQLKIQKLRVMIFTTRVVYSEDVTSKELRELCNNRIACGGTRLHPILDDAIENKINNLIIFTDCVSSDLSETIKDAGKVKIVWCHYTEDYTTEEWKRHNPRYVPTGKVLNIRRKPE